MNASVAVLAGGWSSEREVSLMGSDKITAALREAGYDVRAKSTSDTISRPWSTRSPRHRTSSTTHCTDPTAKTAAFEASWNVLGVQLHPLQRPGFGSPGHGTNPWPNTCSRRQVFHVRITGS